MHFCGRSRFHAVDGFRGATKQEALAEVTRYALKTVSGWIEDAQKVQRELGQKKAEIEALLP